MTTSSVSSVVLKRYAGALIDLAEDKKSVQKIQSDLAEITTMIEESPDLSAFISSPLISRQKQEDVIVEIASKAKLDKLTQNFLGVLVQNRRLNALPGIIKTFHKIVSERSGQVSVRVETATKMSTTQEKEFTKKLSKVIGADITVETQVTPEIIGGMVVTIGSYMVDDSVRRKLSRLGAVLKQGSNQNTVQNLKEVI